MTKDFHETLKQLSKQSRKNELINKHDKINKKIQESPINTEDINFAKEIGIGITLIKNSHRYTESNTLSSIKVRSKENINNDDISHCYVTNFSDNEPPLTFSKNGQGKNDIRKLQKKYWEVVADVDLHGYTQDQAQKVLNQFIQFLSERGVCGEIIHGSGLGSIGYKSVLKYMVRRWLIAHPDVLAYTQVSDTNDGAVRILIKRSKLIENSVGD